MEPLDITNTDEYTKLIGTSLRELAPKIIPNKVPMSQHGINPEWLMSRMASMQMELIGMKLELIALNAMISGATLLHVEKEDESYAAVLALIKTRVDAFVENALAQVKEREERSKSAIISPDGRTL